LAAAAGLLRWAIVASTTAVTALILVQPLHGITFAALHLACMRVIPAIVPPGLAATAQAMYAFGPAAATALLTLASGYVYARLGGHGLAAMRVNAALGLGLVAQPVDRVHDLAIGQPGGNFPGDFFDVAADGAVGPPRLVAVHRVDELIPSVDAAGMIHQHFEERELHGGEVEVRPADRRAMPRL